MEEIYIVTGALGHLGSTIVKDLLKMGKKVRGFDLPNVRFNNLQKDIDMVYGDMTNMDDLEKLFSNIDGDIYVIHCAAIVSISSYPNKNVERVNIGGVRNILKCAFKYKVKKFVYVSSVHAIPEGPKGSIIKEVDHFDPDLVHGTYAKSKAAASNLVMESVKNGLNAVIVHPSGIIGPYDFGNGHLIRVFIDYLNDKLKAIVKGGYDFVDVRDVSIGTINALFKGEKGQCYILTNKYCTIKELIQMASDITGKEMIKTTLPIWFIKPLAIIAELYYKIRRKPPLFTNYSLYTLKSNAIFSHEKATKELDYHPRPLKESVKDMVEFIQKNKIE